jgi:hypothetical protein
MILGWLFVRPIPASSEYEVVNTTEDEEETLLSAPAVVHPSSSQTHLLSTEDGESDVVREDYGVQLLRHIDFWVLFLTMALLTGIGLMCAYSVDISAMHILINPSYRYQQCWIHGAGFVRVRRRNGQQ